MEAWEAAEAILIYTFKYRRMASELEKILKVSAITSNTKPIIGTLKN